MGFQDTFLSAIDRLGEISGEVEADGKFIELAKDYRAKVADFRVLIPLVGSFNAGKTSLVNAWLDRPVGEGLPTDIVPQTALATEVHLTDSADEEGVELYGKDDRLLRRIDLAEFQRVEKQTLTTGESEAEYAKATVHVADSARQKNEEDWKVLVDMPGLDSGLRTHNAAIQRYLPLGSFFILVVDVEHGALRDTEIGQLSEFLEQEVEFVVLVNKIDKKKDAVRDVVEHIEQQVRQRLEKTVQVSPVSSRIPDIAAFEKVIDDVDFDRPLRNFWRPKLLALFNDTIDSLHTRYSALNVSSAERERTVADLEEEQQALEERLRDDEEEVRRHSEQAVERIVRSVRNAIRDHAESLAQTHQSGGRQAFDHELNDLVRRTLNHVTGKELQATLAWIDDRYSADLDRFDARHQKLLRTGGEDAAVLESLPADFAGRVRGAAEASARAFQQGRQRVAGATTAYTAVTGVLAAATSIVAPWLEVVIIALPTIFNWLSRKAEEQERQRRMHEQRVQLQSEISSVVAPRIASELRDRVAVDFASETEEMIEELRHRVQGRIDRIKADIDKSRDEIENRKQDVEKRKEQLRSAISRLTEARKLVAEV